jgi:HD-GYP domain-containing protein (c-di-GMP phosphodiesterase class II)
MDGVFVLKEKSGYANELEEAVAHMADIYNRMRVKKQIPVLEIRSLVMPVITNLVKSGKFLEVLAALHGEDRYESRHAIAVSFISMSIGRWMELEEAELNRLGLAALLHDVGNVHVPPSLLEEPNLDPEEYEIVKSHTLHGYRMIKNTVGLSHRHALVALQHHERMDGSGYPMGIKGTSMDPMSVIVAVAEVFHTLAGEQVYRNNLSFDKMMSEMKTYEFGKLDPVILRLLLNRTMQSLIGHEVILSNDKRGRIIMQGMYDPLRPIVQVGSQYCDLSATKDLSIVKVLLKEI